MAHTECCDSNKTISLTIDGTDVQVPAGTTILDAARKLGIKIPHALLRWKRSPPPAPAVSVPCMWKGLSVP
jgi:Uncharacterized anaerobic dehydrogenase